MSENTTQNIPKTQTPDEIGEELKRLALGWHVVLNERDADFASPRGQAIRATIAPDFTAILDSYPDKMSWDGLLRVWAQELADYPNCRLDATGAQAYVDVDKGMANVFLELNVKFVEGIGFKGMTELKWVRYSDGRWLVRGFYAMRGHSGNTGFV